MLTETVASAAASYRGLRGRCPALGLLALLLLISAAGPGCVADLEPVARRVTPQSFGQKVFTVLCGRLAYSSSLQARAEAEQQRQRDPKVPLPAVDVSGSRYRLACRYGPHVADLPADIARRDPKVAALLEHYDVLVAALDAIFPAGDLPELQAYLTRLLPLTDDGRFPALIEQTAAALEQLEQDEALLASLARLGGREGYRPAGAAQGLMQQLLTYPELSALLDNLLALLGEQGLAHQPLLGLLEALSFALQDAPGSEQPPGDEQGPLQLASDFLVRQRDELPAAGAGALLLAQRDRRGVVRPASAALAEHFLDADHDGLADLDALGQLLTRDGRAAPTPFRLSPNSPDAAAVRDSQGRALDSELRLLYAYLDLDRSLLAALVQELPRLLEPAGNGLLQLLAGLPSLLGDKQQAESVNAAGQLLRYQRYDPQRSPLLDLAYGALQLLRDPQLDLTLELVSRLLREHESALAQLAEAALTAWRISGQHPEAALAPQVTLLDDLLLLAREIVATPGLVEDLLGALADPRTANLGGMLANYLRYRDVHQLDQSTLALINPGFLEPVDRGQPDSGANRSIQQRQLNTLFATSGLRLCNKEGAMLRLPSFGITFDGPFKACELLQIDDAAVFYARSMARLRDAQGQLTDTPKAQLRLKLENMSPEVALIVEQVGLDRVLDLLGGIDGLSGHPTPRAINRLMFLRSLPELLGEVLDPPRDLFGRQISEEHQGTLMSWEVRHPQYSCTNEDPCTFYDALQPLIQAFADHEAEPLFVRTLATLHRYWASRQSGNCQYGDPLAPDYCAGADLVSYEPLLAELSDSRSLFAALYELAQALSQLRLADGSSGSQTLARFLSFLLEPQLSSGLTYRDGRSSSVRADGQAVAGGVSPAYLLLDAGRRYAAALEQPAQQALAGHWRQGLFALGEALLATERQGDQVFFRSPGLLQIAASLIDSLQARVRDRRAQGDLPGWLAAELPGQLEQLLAGPLPARLLELARPLAADPVAAAQLAALGRQLLGYGAAGAFQTTVTGLADLLQLLLDEQDLLPLLRGVGGLLDPQRGLARAALRFLQPAVSLDQGQALSRSLRQAYKPLADGRTPLQVLLQVAASVHRLQPGAGEPQSGQDLAEVLRQVREFLADGDTGLIRFCEIIKSRCGGRCLVP